MNRIFCHGLALVLALAAALPAAAQEVNIYSYRKAHLIEPLLEAFTARTGIAVRLVTGKADALLERLKSEGLNSPADVLLTVDAGRLIRAKAAGVLQPVRSAALERLVPARFRDPEGAWFGLSLRARVIFHARDRVRPGELSTYEDLADPKWRGRLCIRSSGNVYNQSLLASLIEHNGAAEAEAWAKGVVANLARKPQGGDRDQIKAVAAGECDVTVANTYYYAGMLASKREDQRAAAAKVALFWPNQKGRGAHVNISGAGVTRSAQNRDNAVALIEFLASDAAQLIYAEVVNEYPIREGVAIANGVASLGAFKADTIDLAVFAQHQAAAMRVFDRAGWR
jgi:iron(III) transport system substrate-binding protein